MSFWDKSHEKFPLYEFLIEQGHRESCKSHNFRAILAVQYKYLVEGFYHEEYMTLLSGASFSGYNYKLVANASELITQEIDRCVTELFQERTSLKELQKMSRDELLAVKEAVLLYNAKKEKKSL